MFSFLILLLSPIISFSLHQIYLIRYQGYIAFQNEYPWFVFCSPSTLRKKLVPSSQINSKILCPMMLFKAKGIIYNLNDVIFLLFIVICIQCCLFFSSLRRLKSLKFSKTYVDHFCVMKQNF